MDEEEFYQWLGVYLKGMRKKKKRTQDSICQTFKLSRSSLSNIETGRHRLSIYTLYELLCILNEPIEDVFDSMLTHRQSSQF